MRARELDISEIAISISPNSAVEIGDHKSAISQTHSVRVINFGHGALARARFPRQAVCTRAIGASASACDPQHKLNLNSNETLAQGARLSSLPCLITGHLQVRRSRSPVCVACVRESPV